MTDYLELYDYRVRTAQFYHARNRALLSGADPAEIAQDFRSRRDDLFRHHSQSALDERQKQVFQGLQYFPYNPAAVFEVTIDTQIEHRRQAIAMNADEQMEMTTVGRVTFEVEGQRVNLSLYWFEIYGGGLFLPFRDATSPAESYGGGRYLFDTIKGSDFLIVADHRKETGQRIVLDFNYAYNPSCAYNSRWVCPLAPVENRIAVAIRAGEKNYSEAKS